MAAWERVEQALRNETMTGDFSQWLLAGHAATLGKVAFYELGRMDSDRLDDRVHPRPDRYSARQRIAA